MTMRKNKSSAKPLLMVLMVIGFYFVSYYNLVFIMIKHHKGGSWVIDELGFLGPVKRMPRKVDMPGSSMGKFTRIVHWPDQLMDEIPTFLVDPLPAGLDRVNVQFCAFAAILQFIYTF